MRTTFPTGHSRPNAATLSLARGFSPVLNSRRNENRFNGFPSPEQKPLKRLFAPATKPTRLKPGANERLLPTLRPLATRITALIASLLLLAFSGFTQQPTTNNVRFVAVDVFVDSKGKSLAAYQLELSVTNGNAKIVGIEGGEHAAFREAPYYDPKAMQQERVIIAAFSTEPVPKLPTGSKRVATIHIQVSGTGKPEFTVKLQVAADAQDKNIPAEAAVEERQAK